MEVVVVVEVEPGAGVAGELALNTTVVRGDEGGGAAGRSGGEVEKLEVLDAVVVAVGQVIVVVAMMLCGGDLTVMEAWEVELSPAGAS